MEYVKHFVETKMLATFHRFLVSPFYVAPTSSPSSSSAQGTVQIEMQPVEGASEDQHAIIINNTEDSRLEER